MFGMQLCEKLTESSRFRFSKMWGEPSEIFVEDGFLLFWRYTVRRSVKILLSACVLLVIVYFCGVLIFWNRFSVHTFVNGSSIAFQSPEEVTLDLMLQTKQREIEFLKNDGTTEFVSFGDLGIYCESDDAFVDLKLSSWLWFLDIFKKNSYDLSEDLFYSRLDMASKIDKLSFVSGANNRDVSNLSVVEKDGEFRLVYLNHGSYIDTDRLLDVICEHIDDKKFVIDLIQEDCYKTCDVKDVSVDADMFTFVQDKSLLLQNQVTIYLDDSYQEVLPNSVLDACLYEQDGVVMMNPYIIAGYVSNLAEKYDTVGKSRLFSTNGGDVLELMPMDTDTFRGYELNQESLMMSLLNAISFGEQKTIVAPWYSVGRSFGDLDIGDTYVEISISDQYLWYYEDGVCKVQTEVVTGKDSDDWRTPVGVFSVMSLNTNYTMYYPDGSSKADYFVKLTGDGVGIHDSKHRGSYGGDVWRSAGSHGCINVPYDAQKMLFELLKELPDFHIPVVIYE